MSRSGYTDDCDDNWQLIKHRGAVASAIRGKRGQAMLRDLLAALDALPEPKLIDGDLIREDGAVCALGALGKARGIEMSGLDPEDSDTVAATFNVATALACEIVYQNDEWGSYRKEESPETRFTRMRAWIASKIKPEPAP